MFRYTPSDDMQKRNVCLFVCALFARNLTDLKGNVTKRAQYDREFIFYIKATSKKQKVLEISDGLGFIDRNQKNVVENTPFNR